MKTRTYWRLTAGLVALALALTAVLGGCGGGGGGVGGVTGVIQDYDSKAGVADVVVTVGGRSATSQAPTGRFTITGIRPGTYRVNIQPGPIYVPVPWITQRVGVFAGYTNDYGVFWVIDRDSPSLTPDP